MAADPNAVEQVVSRTLRDNLERIQRTADELHQAINDLASACASSRATNALPAMVRAQTSAASLSATLEVLSRFVTSALQPPMRLPFEPDVLRVPSMSLQPPPAASVFEHPPLPTPHTTEEISWMAPAPVLPVVPVAPVAPAAPVSLMPAVSEIFPPVVHTQAVPEMQSPAESSEYADIPAAAETSENVEPAPEIEAELLNESAPITWYEAAPDFESNLPVAEQQAEERTAAVEPAEAGPVFNLDLLPPEEQELHRRAFRVAKVSMQDIKMLRPEDVRVGRENKDLCFRLRDDIEKAHKEYDRRFQSIQGHPVDYFYDWMVEILAGGDPQALGEYPYPSALVRR